MRSEGKPGVVLSGTSASCLQETDGFSQVEFPLL